PSYHCVDSTLHAALVLGWISWNAIWATGVKTGYSSSRAKPSALARPFTDACLRRRLAFLKTRQRAQPVAHLAAISFIMVLPPGDRRVSSASRASRWAAQA